MPVVRGDGRGSGSCCRARRRKSYREVLDSGLSSEANRVRLVVGGWRSAAEVESVGEVASEGARYLRFWEMGDGGAGRVR